MLPTLRRNVRKLSWTLWLVIIAFVVFYGGPSLVQSPGNIVARVDGDPIYVDEYERALEQQAAYYRTVSGGDLPDDFLQQMQIRQIVLDSLIRQKLLLAAARDQGLVATPREVFDRIVQYPVFQDEAGQYVGDTEYRRILRANGIDVTDFERERAEEVLLEKLTGLVSVGVAVTDTEVEAAYQRRNEQVQFDFFLVSPNAYEGIVAGDISDEDLSRRFEENRDAYRLPEQRRVSYALIDTEGIRDTIEIDEDTLRNAYQESIDEFTVPEQVHARHILFRLPPNPDDVTVEESRAAAAEILEQIRDGADFAEMAMQHSDDTTASAGGDLGWFGRGRMTVEFSEVAFSLEAGTTSDLVRTPFGFHIIRVEGHRPEQVREFSEVRGQLEQRLAWERAEEQAADRSEEVRRAVLRRLSLDEVAEQFGLVVETSPLFDQANGFDELPSAQFRQQVFTLGRGRVSEPTRVQRGYVIFRVDEIVDSKVPSLSAVEDRVRQDLVVERAEEKATEVAAEYGRRLTEGEDFNVLANEASAPVRSTEMIPRTGVVPEFGRQPSLVMAAFELGEGDTGGPVPLDRGHALFRVTAHVQPDWGQYGDQQAQLREELLNQRRNSIFESLIRKLRDQYSVVEYEDVKQRVVG